jgi:3-hydroxybutyrate dehydrogenase
MLKDKVAIITGSVNGGIGFATARALAREGASIMLNGFAAKDVVAGRVAELKSEYGVNADYHGADLRRPDEMKDLVQTTKDRLGSVDILVNNAAVRHFGKIEDFPAEDWDESMAVNVSAPFHMIKFALPHMKQRGWGRIINISSTFGFIAAPERVDYVTTKTALLGLTRAVAIENAKTAITCNAICPGTTLTPPIESRIAKLMEDENLERDAAITKFMAPKAPSGRFVDEKNIAGLIAFLCGPYSADFNGAALPIDAGWLSGR